MDSQAINDAFAVLHVALAASAFIFACRILIGEVIPGFGQLSHVFRRQPDGGVWLVLQRVETLIERAKIAVRGFAALWLLAVVLVFDIAPATILLVTGGWDEVVRYFRALPPLSVAFLLVALLPAVLIYWLPDWLERKIRHRLERYRNRIEDIVRQHKSEQRPDHSRFRIEK